MATSIEQRAAQWGDTLGDSQGPIIDLAPGVRLAPYYNAVLLEINGDTWTLPDASVADKFRAPSP
jgi:hypothetical protein